jgi:hypothetical protein
MATPATVQAVPPAFVTAKADMKANLSCSSRRLLFQVEAASGVEVVSPKPVEGAKSTNHLQSTNKAAVAWISFLLRD